MLLLLLMMMTTTTTVMMMMQELFERLVFSGSERRVLKCRPCWVVGKTAGESCLPEHSENTVPAGAEVHPLSERPSPPRYVGRGGRGWGGEDFFFPDKVNGRRESWLGDWVRGCVEICSSLFGVRPPWLALRKTGFEEDWRSFFPPALSLGEGSLPPRSRLRFGSITSHAQP